MNKTSIYRAVRCALMTGTATMLVAPVVFAQTASASSGQDQSQDVSTSTQLGKIEVTGTRIKRTSVETAQPITLITQAQIKASGLTSIGAILQTLTQSGGVAPNAQTNNSGTTVTGNYNLSLRFLGPNRVLVLVNGRRWITAEDGTVDLNEIPTSMIDHIEVLEDGASAIYGSDAISGVVNIITVKNFNGAEANAYLGMYDGHGDGGGWDGKTSEYDFTLGTGDSKGGLMLNVSYANYDPVWDGQRTISKEPAFGEGDAAGSSGTPSGRFVLQGPEFAGQTLGQATCAPWDPNNAANPQFGTCDMTLITPGQTKPTISNFRNFELSDHYNYAPQQYFILPRDQTGVYMAGHYDLADNLTFSSTVVYSHRASQEILAPNPFLIGLPNPGSSELGVGTSTSNPYNPFGTDLVANYSQFCPDNGNAPGCSNELINFIYRRVVEGGDRIYNQSVDTYMFRSGLNGFFDIAGNEWDWDAGYSFGQNSETDVHSGIINTPTVGIAMDSPGYATCNATPKCVPFNIFGGNPSITPAMLNYVSYTDHTLRGNTLRDYTFNLTGTLLNLPAGPLGAAVGAEALQNVGYVHPDALDLINGGQQVSLTDGAEKTYAEYTEFNIPLVSDLPVMKSVSLDIAERWSQFRWSGGEDGQPGFGVTHSAAASTGRAALRWQTSNDLLLRGTWSQGFRLPSLSEFYAGLTQNNNTAPDPCAPVGAGGGYTGSGPLPPGCHGLHVANPGLLATVGGNPDLKPERSISKTVGFVYSPNWIPGFNVGLDYYNIHLQDEVTTIPPATLINGCFISQNAGYCSKVLMNGNEIGLLLDTNVNIGGVHTSGLDLTANYALPTTPIGNFKVGLNWTFLRSFVQTIPNAASPTGFSSTELAGTTETEFSGYPKQQSTLSVNWNYGNWGANWKAQYVDSLYEACGGLQITKNRCSDPTGYFAPSGVTGRNHMGAVVYNDAAVTYNIDSLNTGATFGIRNLLDKQPPASYGSNSNVLGSFYRVPGRFFYVRLSTKF